MFIVVDNYIQGPPADGNLRSIARLSIVSLCHHDINTHTPSLSGGSHDHPDLQPGPGQISQRSKQPPRHYPSQFFTADSCTDIFTCTQEEDMLTQTFAWTWTEL